MLTLFKKNSVLFFILSCNVLLAQSLSSPKGFRLLKSDAETMYFRWDATGIDEMEIWLVRRDNTDYRISKRIHTLGSLDYYKERGIDYTYKALKARFVKGKETSPFAIWYPTASEIDTILDLSDCLNVEITKAISPIIGKYEATFNVNMDAKNNCSTEGMTSVKVRLYFSADSFAKPKEDVLLSESVLNLGTNLKMKGETNRKATTDKGYLFLQVVDKEGNVIKYSVPIPIE
jgi:hypothetical protein